jgi:hypothetical protein
MEEQPDYVDILAAGRMEWEILQLLLLRSDDKLLWTIEEVMDATSDPIAALDGLSVLCNVGLVQRRGGADIGPYVMITRAALRFHQLSTEPPKAKWVRPTA